MFAVKWPSLEIFVLYGMIVKLTTQPTLTLLTLLPFVLHCPNLRELGLFISMSSTDLPSPIIFASESASTTCTSPHCDTKRFKQLTTLFFGFSDIQDEGAITLFLSQLYPLGCNIECEISHTHLLENIDADNFSEELTSELRRRVVRWDEVGKMLAVLTTLRMEERERYRALEREVEDLQLRVCILADLSRWKMIMYG